MDPPGGKYSSSAFDFTAICCPLFVVVVVVVVVIRGFNFCVVVFLSLLLLTDEAATIEKDARDPVNALMFVVYYSRVRDLFFAAAAALRCCCV
jgi:hypothetical protein